MKQITATNILLAIPIYGIFAGIAVWAGGWLHNNNELDAYYYSQLLQWHSNFCICSQATLADAKNAPSDGGAASAEMTEKIKKQMYQEGYSRAKIAKMNAETYEIAYKRAKENAKYLYGEKGSSVQFDQILNAKK